ncbi:general secretion pathway protein E [Parasphingorhabdus marina DSM 22363]|uniref:General secretion pathway protein E n=1 Tax=Parasphingorhabdus marina DSM 22363 TaxID=1123272 RepID=A0A1N6D0M9_9SPHN|nr:ATPase, T2SS/T4P/T4SS family [Parasphingorhabdus marina]SIN64274.1 general secretion pathway protein E [Parasphingorhabdus marina DSM 22363]
MTVETDDGDETGILDRMIRSAIRQHVTNIHLELSESFLVVQFRRGDKLAEFGKLPSAIGVNVIRQIKDMASIKALEHDQSEVGRIDADRSPFQEDIEVSALRYQAKERIVLQIQSAGSPDLRPDMPGLTESARDILGGALAEPEGIILAAGPDVSDRMTAAYALVQQLGRQNLNICTVENSPVTWLDDIVQFDTCQQNDPEFSTGLKAVLRQDPDVVMLEEIPDPCTADIAVRAALEGRLIVAAVPAKNAVGAISRMRNLNTDPFLLASSLRAIVARREVRHLCESCRKPVQANGSMASLLGFDNGTVVFTETGCRECNQTGFQGSTGVFEVIRVDDTVRRLINDGADEARISAHAFLHQPNLSSAARAHVRHGLTTAEEAIRISRPAD